jgi:hypothetical protein
MECVAAPQWKEVLPEWRRKDIRGLYRRAEEELDEDYLRMMSIQS